MYHPSTPVQQLGLCVWDTEEEDTAEPMLGGHHPLQVSAKAAAHCCY